MSFVLTTWQIRNGTKTVTRRLGWSFLKPGDHLMACVKCQGLKPGERLEYIREIRVVSVRRERLNDIEDADCAREGFPQLSAPQFVEMFVQHMKCLPWSLVTRIEFEYVGKAVTA